MKIPAGSISPADPQFPGYVVEFRSQVGFLKDLAKMSWIDSPASEKGAQEEKMRHLESALDKLAGEAVDRLSYEDFKTQNASVTESLVKLAIFLYLEDKLKEFYRESVSMNKDGLFALFDALRDWTSDFLTSDYFGRPASESIKQYLSVESQFVAMAELTGVEVVSIQDAASSYQRNVFERLLAHLKKSESETRKAEPEAPSDKPKPAKTQSKLPEKKARSKSSKKTKK
jgi:hypothetical protein